MRRKKKPDKPLKWYYREGIPGCKGESGVYYNESYTEEERTRLERYFLALDRENRRKTIIRVLTMTLIVLIAAGLITARIWLLLKLQ